MLEIIIIILALALDQGTKAIAQAVLPGLPGGSYPLINGVFHFTYLENAGAAFGMMQGMRTLFLILTVLACSAVVYVMITRRKSLSKLMRISLALILSGALGNFIDRLLLGYVRDFMHFALIDFAVFNMADACITVGTVLFAVYVLFLADKKPKGDAEQAGPEGEADAEEPMTKHDEKGGEKDDVTLNEENQSDARA